MFSFRIYSTRLSSLFLPTTHFALPVEPLHLLPVLAAVPRPRHGDLAHVIDVDVPAQLVQPVGWPPQEGRQPGERGRLRGRVHQGLVRQVVEVGTAPQCQAAAAVAQVVAVVAPRRRKVDVNRMQALT